MLKANKNVPNGKKSGSGKFLELQAYSKGSSHKLSKEKTVIGKDITIEGNIRGREHMIIDGSVELITEEPQRTFSTEEPTPKKAEA